MRVWRAYERNASYSRGRVASARARRPATDPRHEDGRPVAGPAVLLRASLGYFRMCRVWTARLVPGVTLDVIRATDRYVPAERAKAS